MAANTYKMTVCEFQHNLLLNYTSWNDILAALAADDFE